MSHIPLSSLFTDPRLRAAFARAERDDGAAYAIPAPQTPVLNGGAGKVLRLTQAAREALSFLADAAIMLLDEADALTEELEDNELEAVCEDEGAQCDDEGDPEPDMNYGWPEWDGKGMHVAFGTAHGDAI